MDIERDLERNLGPQPLGALLERHGLSGHDLVTASSEQITHKMVARAVKGRRLSPKVMEKILRALQAALAGTDAPTYALSDLFTYAGSGTKTR